MYKFKVTVLIIDDTVEAKPHMDENDLICWLLGRLRNISYYDNYSRKLVATHFEEDIDLFKYTFD